MEKETQKPKTPEKNIQQLWAENEEHIKEIFANPLAHTIEYLELLLLGIYPPSENKKLKSSPYY